MSTNIKILAIVGSLRKNSANMSVIRAVASMVPANVEFNIYEGLGNLPQFNDSDDAPETVKEFRRLVKEADGVFICTPEYAFGVPGVLKNCLDWTVGSGEFDRKPVAFISAATGGENAYTSLRLTLTALSTNLAPGASLLISFVRSKLDEAGHIKDHDTHHAVKTVLDVLIDTIREAKL